MDDWRLPMSIDEIIYLCPGSIKLKIFNALASKLFQQSFETVCPTGDPHAAIFHRTGNSRGTQISRVEGVFTAPENRKNAKHSANRNNLRATSHLRELPCVLNCSQLWLDPDPSLSLSKLRQDSRISKFPRSSTSLSNSQSHSRAF